MKKLILLISIFVKFASADCTLLENNHSHDLIKSFGNYCVKLEAQNNDYKLSLSSKEVSSPNLEFMLTEFNSSDFTSLESDKNKIGIVFSYPRNDYIINLKLSDNKFIIDSALYINKSSDKISDNEVLILENKKIVGKELSQSNIDSLFDKKRLSLNKIYSLIITSPKAYFYDKPIESTRTKKYVILGDEITITQYQDDFFYAKYTNSHKIKISGWIKINDIL